MFYSLLSLGNYPHPPTRLYLTWNLARNRGAMLMLQCSSTYRMATTCYCQNYLARGSWI